MLIDELFKGTNVQDAMKCSSTVIKGLIRIHNSLFILSTHLYEIGEELKAYPNIVFLVFRDQCPRRSAGIQLPAKKEGISNDRLGYLILEASKWWRCWKNCKLSTRTEQSHPTDPHRIRLRLNEPNKIICMRWRPWLLFFGLVLLFGIEILRVYLIMPFPGSQQRDTIHVAYFLDRNVSWLRIVALSMILPLLSRYFP